MQAINKSFLIFAFLSLVFFPSNAQITYEPAFPNLDFEFPVELQSSSDGTDRMFVVEQAGRIKVFPRDPNVTSATTFLDITNLVYFEVGQEIGLLGLAFHPDYATNGYFYVYYTIGNFNTDIEIVLSRFSVSSGDINLADPNSELTIFQFDKNQFASNHNGGKIAFGPDNYLYISFGDGGGANDPEGNGQNINTVFGSICRIDVDVDGSNPLESNPELPNGNYEIPSDNPLVGQPGLDEIYAYGIRNTWKFSFDFPTNRLWGADVGQNAFEEINLIENGENYGWSRFEANSIANSGVTIDEPTTFPVFSYDRSQGVSITGGYVYRGSDISTTSPNINGKYIFGDYVRGNVWALDYNETTGDATSTLLFQTNGEFISSFGLDESGELYFSDYGTNAQIYKLDDGITNGGGIAVNGFGTWESLGQEPDGEIYAVATSTNGDIYNGGSFSQANGVTVNNIALWDGNSWLPLGSGANASINALKILPNGNLVAGGSFTEIGGINTSGIAIWDGTTWSSIGTGINGSVFALAIDDNSNIYAAGIFETLNGVSTRNIAYWDGSQWSNLADSNSGISGTNNEIRSLEIDDSGILYAGGNFDEAGGVSANRIATWNGTNWGTLGEGTSGFVQAITSNGSDIYAGGNFAIAGGITVNRIARWDKNTSSWSTLGNGVNDNVNALLHDGTNLFAGGVFDIAFDTNGDYIVNNIARWNEANGWQAMGTNTQVGVDVNINAMQFASDEFSFYKVYTGGIFQTAGAINANNTAVWISENLPTITSTNTDILCFGESTGAIDLNVTGNATPYSFEWATSDGSGLEISQEDQTGLSAGTYQVTITDANNWSTTYSVLLSHPDELTCSVTQDNPVSTAGGNDGAATVTPAGGVEPYTYLWDNSETTQTAVALTGGEHTVIVTDANGCETNCMITIGEPGTFVCNIVEDSGVSCFGEANGQATVTPSGGVSPYTYLWDNSETTQTALALTGGSHSVVVTDAEGETTSCSITISGPTDELSFTYTKNDVLCFGDSSGNIDLNISGGTPPYTYSWSNNSTNQDLNGLLSGDYTFIVMDANDCIITDTITIVEPTELSCTINQINNSDATANPMGGTEPYTYLWDNMETTQTVTNLTNGVHSVNITDANGCITTCDVSIDAPFTYYPNPTTGILNLSETVNWTLANSLGQVISTGNSDMIDLSYFDSGIYVLGIENDRKIKIIKQ